MGTAARPRPRRRHSTRKSSNTIMKLFTALAVLAVAASLGEAGKKRKDRRCCGKCKPKKAAPACAEKAVDVIFVLDGSSSVGPKNFTVAQNFINGIVDKFNVSPQGVKVALLQYSTRPRIEFNLNDHTSKAAVKQAVENVQWILGDTHTALALRETHNSIVAPALSNG